MNDVLDAHSQPAIAPDQKGITLNSSTSTPTAEQLSAARLAKWHQDAAPLLTIEDLRAWITRSGLVLWSSRAQQLPAPAPSLVEATLGAANAEPSLEEQASARSLLARLIAEGVAVPLNLLGVTGGTGTDTPDFVVSAPVFSYIFTLRGNKAWKQSPVTSGPVKVSPLALAAYEILSAKVTLSAYDLTTQLGKEVTEAAVLRSLTELWSQLRVLPIPQQDGSATLWELSTARFTKQIKAGANAGQPSALSALISLYLGQAIAATEEEIETFLSPLAPRSRVRDVIHALLGARQLETFVVEGKTLLHVGGDLPAFAAAAADSAEPGDAVAELNQELTVTSEDGSRIRKYTPKPGSKIGTGLRTKPAFGARAGKPSFGSKPAYGSGDRERRPFKRDGDRTTRPSFSKPWQEDRKPRADAPGAEQEGATPRTYTQRPSRPFGDRPSAGAGRPGQRPGGFGAKRSFGGEREGSGPRKTFSKPGTFGRKRESSFEAAGSDARPPRRDFGDGSRPSFDRGERPERSDRGERPPAGGLKRSGSYSPRPAFGRKPGLGGKPAFRGARPEGGERPERPAGGFARKPFTPREGGGDRPAFGRKPSFGVKPSFSPDRGDSAGASGSEAPRKVFRKFDAPRSPKPFGSKPKFGGKPSFGSDRGERGPGASSDRPARPSFGAKPGGPRPGGGKSFGEKKPSAFAGKGGPFAKFADGKKPFRKPGPGKPRPAGGGFTPTRRKRPEGGA